MDWRRPFSIPPSWVPPEERKAPTLARGRQLKEQVRERETVIDYNGYGTTRRAQSSSHRGDRYRNSHWSGNRGNRDQSIGPRRQSLWEPRTAPSSNTARHLSQRYSRLSDQQYPLNDERSSGRLTRETPTRSTELDTPPTFTHQSEQERSFTLLPTFTYQSEQERAFVAPQWQPSTRSDGSSHRDGFSNFERQDSEGIPEVHLSGGTKKHRREPRPGGRGTHKQEPPTPRRSQSHRYPSDSSSSCSSSSDDERLLKKTKKRPRAKYTQRDYEPAEKDNGQHLLSPTFTDTSTREGTPLESNVQYSGVRTNDEPIHAPPVLDTGQEGLGWVDHRWSLVDDLYSGLAMTLTSAADMDSVSSRSKSGNMLETPEGAEPQMGSQENGEGERFSLHDVVEQVATRKERSPHPHIPTCSSVGRKLCQQHRHVSVIVRLSNGEPLDATAAIEAFARVGLSFSGDYTETEPNAFIVCGLVEAREESHHVVVAHFQTGHEAISALRLLDGLQSLSEESDATLRASMCPQWCERECWRCDVKAVPFNVTIEDIVISLSNVQPPLKPLLTSGHRKKGSKIWTVKLWFESQEEAEKASTIVGSDVGSKWNLPEDIAADVTIVVEGPATESGKATEKHEPMLGMEDAVESPSDGVKREGGTHEEDGRKGDHPRDEWALPSLPPHVASVQLRQSVIVHDTADEDKPPVKLESDTLSFSGARADMLYDCFSVLQPENVFPAPKFERLCWMTGCSRLFCSDSTGNVYSLALPDQWPVQSSPVPKPFRRISIGHGHGVQEMKWVENELLGSGGLLVLVMSNGVLKVVRIEWSMGDDDALAHFSERQFTLTGDSDNTNLGDINGLSLAFFQTDCIVSGCGCVASSSQSQVRSLYRWRINLMQLPAENLIQSRAAIVDVDRVIGITLTSITGSSRIATGTALEDVVVSAVSLDTCVVFALWDMTNSLLLAQRTVLVKESLEGNRRGRLRLSIGPPREGSTFVRVACMVGWHVVMCDFQQPNSAPLVTVVRPQNARAVGAIQWMPHVDSSTHRLLVTTDSGVQIYEATSSDLKLRFVHATPRKLDMDAADGDAAWCPEAAERGRGVVASVGGHDGETIEVWRARGARGWR
ncbi:hypothetical protein M427DRAFT_153558 [Gonapodya prolifera JEL478]|uniref:Uncharacterized protein n=1 Tax=Gonapodya prolifera (strain JEL478) TaxID=1344416 RepID=A0A139AMW1_GONPJ|nr:hypothetical protein M427DRAFT_153558 [Gonapodya prolifera JEL478]|eukprot:KXS18038.1 hypothetical protein M427DRAFT_153558 [Gonapodya prolifera JEL478]